MLSIKQTNPKLYTCVSQSRKKQMRGRVVCENIDTIRNAYRGFGERLSQAEQKSKTKGENCL